MQPTKILRGATREEIAKIAKAAEEPLAKFRDQLLYGCSYTDAEGKRIDPRIVLPSQEPCDYCGGHHPIERGEYAGIPWATCPNVPVNAVCSPRADSRV